MTRSKFASSLGGIGRDAVQHFALSIPTRWAKKTASDGAKRASSCRQLPISEAGTTSRLGAATLAAGFALALQQQVDHLNRLAQPHVVGQAAAQAQFRHEPEPAHALGLVGPQSGLQIAARLAARRSSSGWRSRSSVSRSQSPAVMRDHDGDLLVDGFLDAQVGAGKQPHARR